MQSHKVHTRARAYLLEFREQTLDLDAEAAVGDEYYVRARVLHCLPEQAPENVLSEQRLHEFLRVRNHPLAQSCTSRK